jgi:hypothetical protein
MNSEEEFYANSNNAIKNWQRIINSVALYVKEYRNPHAHLVSAVGNALILWDSGSVNEKLGHLTLKRREALYCEATRS